jgi:hypothetical protein
MVPCCSVDIGIWQGVAMDSLKFHSGPTMPNPSTPCGRATPETANKVGAPRLSSTPLDPLHHTPMSVDGIRKFPDLGNSRYHAVKRVNFETKNL